MVRCQHSLLSLEARRGSERVTADMAADVGSVHADCGRGSGE